MASYATDGQLPKDVNGLPSEGVYVPNIGTVAQQGALLGADTGGQPYACTLAQLTQSAVSLQDGLKATYGATISALASATSATDIFTIIGSATKTVRITRLEISGEATTAVSIQVQLLTRSTADTTGTSTAPTVVPYDSASAAGTAVVKAYTANPGALGTLVGAIKSDFLYLSAPATATVGAEKLNFDFGNRPAQAVVLRGVAQTLVVNLGAVTVTGGSFDINIEWTEE